MGHIYQKVQLRGEKTATVRMLVDTGATYSVISPRLARAFGNQTAPKIRSRHARGWETGSTGSGFGRHQD